MTVITQVSDETHIGPTTFSFAVIWCTRDTRNLNLNFTRLGDDTAIRMP